MARRSKGPSARDAAEVASGKGSARDRAEVRGRRVRVKSHKRSKPGRSKRKTVKVKRHRRKK